MYKSDKFVASFTKWQRRIDVKTCGTHGGQSGIGDYQATTISFLPCLSDSLFAIICSFDITNQLKSDIRHYCIKLTLTFKDSLIYVIMIYQFSLHSAMPLIIKPFLKTIFLFCRLQRTLQHAVQQEMDVVDLTGGYTAATLWQKFAVMDSKEYFHCIITIASTGAGTDTV
jgi:hypothetical protein